MTPDPSPRPRARLAFTAIASLTLACANPAKAAAPDAVDKAQVALVNRVTWGADPSTMAAFKELGEQRFLERQLHPGRVGDLPPAIQAQIDRLTIHQKPATDMALMFYQTRKAINAMTDPDKKKAANEAYYKELGLLGRDTAQRSLLRDIYSQDQLLEQMTWFWTNHFSVFKDKNDVQTMLADYEDQAIRAHALGRFRDLLGAVVHHPVMLRYLDNDQNAAGHINENYARELMELHTLGVDGGYSQKDVEALAHVLTGLGVNLTPDTPNVKPQLRGDYVRRGIFEFNPNRHDYGTKTLLGHTIRGSGLHETDEALDILCRDPATARFISRRLAMYFVSDSPPKALVDRMAATFQRSDGEIAEVLRTLFAAPEFRASLGSRFKDPVHYAVSAVRMAYDDKPILNPQPINYWLTRMGEPLYGHLTPDGYALTSAAWAGPGQMATRFEIARAIGTGSAGLFKLDAPGAVDQPAFPQVANALYYVSLQPTLRPATRTALDQASSPQEWNTLFLSSPEFMYR
jgi:uncharacterized protein (DUF1800 family)